MPSAEETYVFRHAVVRDAAYELQLPTDRESLHGIAARVMIDLHADSLESAAAEIARHLRLGGSDQELEREFVIKGAQYANDNFDQHSTIEMLERLVEIGTDADEMAARQILFGAYIRFRDDKVRAREHALGLFRTGRSSGKQGAVSRALSLLAATRSGARSVRLNRRAYRIAARAGARFPAGLALGNMGVNLIEYDPRKGERILRRAIALNAKAGNRAGEGYFRGTLAARMLRSNRLEEAERLVGEAVAILEQIGAKQYLPTVYATQARVLDKQGRLDEADRVLRHGIEMGRETGIARDIGALSYERACVCLKRGLHEEAVELWRTARTLFTEWGYLEELKDQRQSLQQLCEELYVPMPE
ncbi:MAG: hypothetical protein K8I27_11895 [Planctomycetes bacterium]|nr:hypothetical protein [Planctomycetota bacterium]